jgi:hypothetical protein
MENLQAEREGRVPRRIPKNRDVKQYPCGGINIMPPMGMAQNQPQQAQAQQNNQYPGRPVGGGSNPQFNPINSFGALSTTGVINGNAAFGAKNSPDSSKTADVIKRATRSDALTKLMDLSVTDPVDVDYYNEEYEEELAGRKAAAVDELEHENPEEKPPHRPSLLATGLMGAGAGLGAFGLGKALDASGYSPSKLVQPYLPETPDWLKNLGTKLEEYMTPKAASSDSKTDKNTPCSCGCGDTVSTCKCSQSYSCRKPGGSCYKPAKEKDADMVKYSAAYVMKIARCWAGYEPVPGKKPYSNDSCRPVGSGKKKKKKEESKSEKEAGTPAWQRSAGKNDAGGLNEKGRKSYEREHGGNLKAPVTQKNPKGEAKKRQNSFCSRMCGMKRVNTGSKTKSDPDSRINKSLRKWNCKCSSAQAFGEKIAAETRK